MEWWRTSEKRFQWQVDVAESRRGVSQVLVFRIVELARVTVEEFPAPSEDAMRCVKR